MTHDGSFGQVRQTNSFAVIIMYLFLDLQLSYIIGVSEAKPLSSRCLGGWDVRRVNTILYGI